MDLEFTSWWWENSTKERLAITYLRESGALQVHIKDLETVVIDSPLHASGRKLEIWDMFVGSEIDILGKFTILKQCDIKTAQWNMKTGKKLLKIRDQLIEEIRKYDNKPFPQRLLVIYQTDVSGGVNLKALMVQISELRDILCKYRPSIANKIASI
jgi:hypothetical protein